jgi:hypothetical protein
VRFINGSPDSTALNFALNGQVDAAATAYLGSSSTFASFPAASYDVSATELGATVSLSDEVDALSASTSYLVVGFGIENYNGTAGPEPAKRFRATAIPVTLSVPNGGLARIIVLHAFNRAPGFDTPAIDFQDTGSVYTPLSNISFGGTATLTVTPGYISFEAVRDGTSQVYATDGAGFTFAAGKTYFALVSGIEGRTGTQAPAITYFQLD